MDAGSQTQQGDALSEGRRIYLGNLLYSVQPGDVEDLLRQVGFEQSFEKLHISIDPISGRNPGYCFAEFISKEEADRALDVLPGNSIMNRSVKVGPCNPKTSPQSRNGAGRADSGYTPTFNRWGDWKGDDSKARRDAEQGPYGAIRHLDNKSRRGGPEKAQLYIGGLGMMTSQPQHDAEMQELLNGFEL
jgi:RNA recognition motif-containing protein